MMKKMMQFMTETFAPKVNKVVNNPWVSAIQDAIMAALPLVFVGSIITMFDLLENIISSIPDLSMISDFSFGMYALVVAFLIPYFLMEKKGFGSQKIISGASSLVLFMMLLFPTITADGKATFILPSLFNINEPLVFGAPIAFNPYLMVPMWLNGLLMPSIVYGVMKIGLVTIPSSTFLLWYMPYPVASYLATQDGRAIVLCILLFIVSWLVFLPFFKAYDNTLLKKEAQG